ALVKAGAKLEAKKDDGSTPLHMAAWNNANPEVITALVKAGAKLGVKDKDGNTPLHDAARNNSKPEVIVTLVKARADARVKNNNGNLPIDLAKNNERLKTNEALLEMLRKASIPEYEPLQYRKAMFEDYKLGTKLETRGTVEQILGNKLIIVLAIIRYGKKLEEQKIAVEVKGRPRALTNDFIVIRGSYLGVEDFETLMGETVSMPCIEAHEYRVGWDWE
ncbi:MAG: ankyrin repeat domain-containing protein, partial [Verrucomicrobiae bacterium]|nr:ankyrin repeat domain-containing protein [Verrucomicrobiae bacterium]